METESCGYPDPIRAHAVLGTDREKPVLRRVSRAAHVQLGIVNNGRKNCPPTVFPSRLSLFLLLSSSSLLLHQCLGGGTHNNPQTQGEFDPSSGRIHRFDDSPSSSVTERVTQIADT